MTDSCAGRKSRLRVPRWPSAMSSIFLCFLCAGTPRFTLGIVCIYPPFDFTVLAKRHKEVDVSCDVYRSLPTGRLCPSNGQLRATYCGAGGWPLLCGALTYLSL